MRCVIADTLISYINTVSILVKEVIKINISFMVTTLTLGWWSNWHSVSGAALTENMCKWITHWNINVIILTNFDNCCTASFRKTISGPANDANYVNTLRIFYETTTKKEKEINYSEIYSHVCVIPTIWINRNWLLEWKINIPSSHRARQWQKLLSSWISRWGKGLISNETNIDGLVHESVLANWFGINNC